MSYTAKRLTILLMAWGLIVFIGVTVRINLNAPPPPQVTASPTAVSAPLAAPTAATDAADRAAQLQQSLAQNPNDLPALTELAAITYQQKDWEGAITLYGRAIGLDPHNVDLRAKLAAAQLYALRFSDAQATLKQAIALDSRRADLHLLLGLADSRLVPPDNAGAAAEWRQVIALAPNTDLARQAQDLLNTASSPGQ